MNPDPFPRLDPSVSLPEQPPALPVIEPDALVRRLAGLAQVYVVGGAVRDALLGEPAGDRDWVVVGARAQDLLDLGFRPVGQDFPVFLHPQTQDEFALARTERKSAPGYGGFVFHADPSVTLEQDLLRRDLTLNAMAQTLDGRLIDPLGGWRDLRAGVLRHVSDAFTEDPLRVLRLARLAARWPQFTVALGTQQLLAQLARSGELQALVPERLWREVARAIVSKQPSRFGQVLGDCGAWSVLLQTAGLPEGLAQWSLEGENRWGSAWRHLDPAEGLGLDERWTLLWLARTLLAGDDSASVLDHAAVLQRVWRVPSSAQELLACAARERAALVSSSSATTATTASMALSPRSLLDALQRLDAWRRPQRAQSLWALVQHLDTALPGAKAIAWAAQQQHAAWQRLQALDQAQVIRAAQERGAKGPAIGQALDAARLALLQQAGPGD
ncbi:multifunctional CCA tRNA nucleotidyl transferase/2'3'-cyclic phosphodiesterase/2'nucleotidase/phosphatase [Amphibiibacter pelophylacis]|uniref:Multifunctional CCA tRNA nucleotidyl transferase/2'3'-cyclic phosphodiesterase/2'nucleotidase/phosphatase n=1 Tax=Amphibiibacter pelophylacis TaxID=1799477 RepID=A0ACC6P3Z2_9BURK